MALILRKTTDTEYLQKMERFQKQIEREKRLRRLPTVTGFGFRILSSDDHAMALAALKQSIDRRFCGRDWWTDEEEVEGTETLLQRLEDALTLCSGNGCEYWFCDVRFNIETELFFAGLYKTVTTPDESMASSDYNMGYVAFEFAIIESSALTATIAECVKMMSERLDKLWR